MLLKKTIMLVDDDSTTNYLNKIIFRERFPDYNFIIHEDSLEAVNHLILLHEKQMTLPDLILLDLNMPVMDGFEFLEELKKVKITVPIAILSTSEILDEKLKSLKYNVLDFIVKPLVDSHLKKLLEKIYEEKE
jgi:CheY-like chemotaxis protein